MLLARRFTAHHRGGTKTYHIEIVKVPWWRHVYYKAYHKYDMYIPIRVPGWKRFEEWLQAREAETFVGMFEDDNREPRLRDRILSWTVKQDFRCFDLSRKGCQTIKRIEVSEEEYKAAGASADV